MDKVKRTIQPIINQYHKAKAAVASVYYSYPGTNLKVIGVTGTDGKTTTSHLIHHILTEAGKKSSLISSVYAKIGSEEFDTGLHVTTPDAKLVQKLLRQAVDQGSEYFVLETTSHALDQNRNWGITYAASVITNITHEHLDYHKNYENYVNTKAKILQQSLVGIINKDDASFPLLQRYAAVHGLNKRVKTYALQADAQYTIDLRKELKLSLPEFNAYNYLAAYAVCTELGIDKKKILTALKSFTLPKGRLEVVYDKEFRVIIDFAHTPNSFEQLLPALKKETKGRLIHVFGSAGLRDQRKRPLMGEASAKSSDVVIVTEEDYRSEDPKKIADEIAQGLERHSFVYVSPTLIGNDTKPDIYTVELDRKKAIELAISLAKKGDTIVCTGKSHEKSINRDGVEYPWSEHETVKNALKKRR